MKTAEAAEKKKPEKANVTLKVNKNLLRKARIKAAREGTSLSALLAQFIEKAVEEDEAYEAAKRRALARLAKGFDLGFTPPKSRDELYDR